MDEFLAIDHLLLLCEQQLRRWTVQFTAQSATHSESVFVTTSIVDHVEQ